MTRAAAIFVAYAVLGCGSTPKATALRATSTIDHGTAVVDSTAEAPTDGVLVTTNDAAQPRRPVPRGAESAQAANAPSVLLLESRDLLRDLQTRGVTFDQIALGTPAATRANASLAELGGHPGFEKVVATLEADLAEMRRRDGRLGVGMRYSHRAFDPRWLRSEHFHLELAGVVNRLDRRPFTPGACGEVRFLYRAAYSAEVSGQLLESRVPLTINVVRTLPVDPNRSCQAEAQRWVPPSMGPPTSDWLLSKKGPLGDWSSRTTLRAIEVNLQSVRWPSTIRPDMTGHAEYILRVFEPDDSGGFRAAPLENTPDTERIARSTEDRATLIKWLSTPSVLRAIDTGTVNLPAQLSSHRAISVAPHGMARLANRPFARLGLEGALGSLDLSGYETFSSADTLLRRLDGLSCPGCHQTHSVAGFHFLGEDDGARRADVIAVAHSRHVEEELSRRAAYVSELTRGREPNELRPSAERMADGSYGSFCGLDATGALASWTCDPGLTCTRLSDEAVGTCLPESPGPGDACQPGVVRPHPNPHRDRLLPHQPLACSNGLVCESRAVGFPGGMCAGPCDDAPLGSACGAIAQLTEFNHCLGRNVPFEACILNNSRPAALRSCSAHSPCRDDYICARTPSGEGACIPPYFLFQMRVDGHVLPPTSDGSSRLNQR